MNYWGWDSVTKYTFSRFFSPGETVECLILETCMRIPKIEVFGISGIWKLISISKWNDVFYNMHKYTLGHSIALN